MAYVNKVDLVPALRAWTDVVFEEEWSDDSLVASTRLLRNALREVAKVREEDNPVPRELPDYFSEAYQITRNLIGLSGQYLWDDYTDSDVDARCDVEWDVHMLQKALDPTHTIPDDVEPAYVMATIFTKDEED